MAVGGRTYAALRHAAKPSVTAMNYEYLSSIAKSIYPYRWVLFLFGTLGVFVTVFLGQAVGELAIFLFYISLVALFGFSMCIFLYLPSGKRSPFFISEGFCRSYAVFFYNAAIFIICIQGLALAGFGVYRIVN